MVMGIAYRNQADSRERELQKKILQSTRSAGGGVETRVTPKWTGGSLAKTRSSEGSQGKVGLSRVVEETEFSSCLKLMSKFSLTFNIRKVYIIY